MKKKLESSPTDFMRHKYHSLDGIRGIAALLIVVRHMSDWFDVVFPESYLAVDLFFVLSGFVIAEAYSHRLNHGLSVGGFMRIRFIRLYPLYILGTLIGLIGEFVKWGTGMPSQVLDGSTLWINFTLAAVMLPSPSGGYPLNAPAWTLFFELIGNYVYAATHPFLRNEVLLLIMAISAIWLVHVAKAEGHLDTGGSWTTFHVGLARVLFSLNAGVLIHRAKGRIRLSVNSLLILLAASGLLCLTPPAEFRDAYAILNILVVFPVLVLLGSATEPTPGLLTRTYAILGETSYALYVLHLPLSLFARGAVRLVTGQPAKDFAPLIGLALLVALLALSWCVDRLYDRPVRRFLSSLCSRSKQVDTEVSN